MKIKSVSFENYKAFSEKQTMQIKPITVLIGKNSSGKSSIAKLFTLFENSLMGNIDVPLLLKNHGVELGGEFDNLFFENNPAGIPLIFKIVFQNNVQIIFISEYFRLNPDPTLEQCKALENWFWVTTYSNYFTVYSISQQRSAYQEFCDFAKGEHPDGIYKVNSDTLFSTAKYPDKLNFTGVRAKALQLFYLKSIIENNEIQDREGIKEIFISFSSKKDRNPANIILRLSSEFEENKERKKINNFIETSSIQLLDKHFITQEMVDLYKLDKIDDFISKRENYLKLKEREFVEKIGIRYTD